MDQRYLPQLLGGGIFLCAVAAALGVTQAWPAVTAGALLVWWCGYAVGVLQVTIDVRGDRAWFGWMVASVVALALAVPPAGSDMYHYLTEFSILVQGHGNPFLVAPANVQLPIATLSFWKTLPSQHGPALQWIGAVVAWISGGSVLGLLVGWKLVNLATLFGLVWVSQRLVQRLQNSPTFSAAFFVGANPLIVYETLVTGGTDGLMILFVMLGLWLLLDRRVVLAAVSITLSILVKYASVVIVPLVILAALYRSGWWRTVLAVLVAAGTAVVVWWPFWTGPEVLAATRWVGEVVSTSSLVGSIELVRYLVRGNDWEGLRVFWWIVWGVVEVGLVGMFYRRRNDDAALVQWSAAALAAFLLLAKFWWYAKYLVWVVPLLLVVPGGMFGAVMLSSVLVVSPFNPELFIFFAAPVVLLWAGWRHLSCKFGYAR